MKPSVKIFKNELINCIEDMIDIMDGSFSGDPYARKLSGELKVAKSIVVPLGENGVSEILKNLMKCTIPLKDKIEQRDEKFFEGISICTHCAEESDQACVCVSKCGDECLCEEWCINCSDILTEMDSKTFKAIKMVMRKGDADDIKMCFDYIDCFMAAGEKYRLESKEKVN